MLLNDPSVNNEENDRFRVAIQRMELMALEAKLYAGEFVSSVGLAQPRISKDNPEAMTKQDYRVHAARAYVRLEAIQDALSLLKGVSEGKHIRNLQEH